MHVFEMYTQAIGSRLTVGGELRFINNTVDDGGALYLLSFAQIMLSSGTRMLFQGNRGRYIDTNNYA